MIADYLQVRFDQAPADSCRKTVISWTWRLKILMHLETKLMGSIREKAEEEAIQVFARNIHHLLMAATAGLRATMGLEPGLPPGINAVGVDLNTASVPLLIRGAGLPCMMAQHIVSWRDEKWPFPRSSTVAVTSTFMPKSVLTIRRRPAHPRTVSTVNLALTRAVIVPWVTR